MDSVSVETLAAEKLGPTSTASERVAGLVDVLDIPLVAKAAKVSSTAVRKWIDGTEPRADAAMTIDDLRSVVVVLLEAGFEPARVRSWFLSRNRAWLEGERPLDRLSRTPISVLSAANDAAMIHRFGSEAAARMVENSSDCS
jgi:hypothetical protein